MIWFELDEKESEILTREENVDCSKFELLSCQTDLFLIPSRQQFKSKPEKVTAKKNFEVQY